GLGEEVLIEAPSQLTERLALVEDRVLELLPQLGRGDLWHPAASARALGIFVGGFLVSLGHGLELADRAVVVLERVVVGDPGGDAVALQHLRSMALERAVADRQLVDGRPLERELVLGVGVEIGVAPLLVEVAGPDLTQNFGQLDPRSAKVLGAAHGLDPLGIATSTLEQGSEGVELAGALGHGSGL